MLGKTRRVHFIGIGGIGMSGIAELLANLGYAVSGSDERQSPLTERLASKGIRVAYGHQASNVGEADVVVVSSAVRPTNVEVLEAARRHIPVIPRAEMLAELMRLRYSIAVAGAHGKTTTTSMIALVLERAGLDPTAVIGGRLSAFGSNARLGRSELMVAEADESDRSFLKLSPTIAVITNIDYEHLESYRGFDDLQQAFVDFANRVPFYGAVVGCADDRHLAAVLPRVTRRVTTYGLEGVRGPEKAALLEGPARLPPSPKAPVVRRSVSEGGKPRATSEGPPRATSEGSPRVASKGAFESADAPDITAVDIELAPLGSRATVKRRIGPGTPPTTLGRLDLHVPGRHNLQNALAAVAVGLELDLPFDRIAAGLAEFRGAERRFEVRGEPNGILVVDDYGHHPTEIAAVIAAAQTLNRRIVVAFQPHRFTRTAALMNAFGPALDGAAHIVLTDIYAAGEDPIPGVNLEALAESIRRSVSAPVQVVASLDEVVPALSRIARPGDIVITLGAGSIGALPERLIEALAKSGSGSSTASAESRGASR